MNNALAEQRESHRPKGAMMRVRLKADGRIVEILADGSEQSLQRAPRANLCQAAQADAVYARGVRARTKLTQAEFAARIGVPIETVRNWEQGKRSPRGPAARAAQGDRQGAAGRLCGAWATRRPAPDHAVVSVFPDSFGDQRRVEMAPCSPAEGLSHQSHRRRLASDGALPRHGLPPPGGR